MAKSAFMDETGIKREENEDEPSPKLYSIKQENGDEEELERPVCVFVEPIEKVEGVCFKEETDPLAPSCENFSVASIKQEDSFSFPGAEGPPRPLDEDQAVQRRALKATTLSSPTELQPQVQKPLFKYECDNTLTSSQGLQDHTRQHEASDLVSHKLKHIPERQYSCDVCGKNLTKAAGLSLQNRRNPGKMSLSCDLCAKKLTFFRNTTRCKELYPSDLCRKTFKKSSLLTTHKRLHTGKHPYPFDECGKAFTSSSTLISHKRWHTAHPYPCTVCGKVFITFSPSTHKRLHTGECPYPCDVCRKIFTSSSTLINNKP